MGEAGTIRRRRYRRPERKRAPDGSRVNVTANLDSATYNRLCDLADETGTSISYIVECLCSNRKVVIAAKQPSRPAKGPSATEMTAAVEAAMRKFLADEGGAVEH